jgi:hypothetical protein
MFAIVHLGRRWPGLGGGFRRLKRFPLSIPDFEPLAWNLHYPNLNC